MDVGEKVAELLARLFPYYNHPMRHAEYIFPHGRERIRVTVEIISGLGEYESAMEATGWVATISTN